LLSGKQDHCENDITDGPAKPIQPCPHNKGQPKGVEAVVGVLEGGEAELHEDVDDEEDDEQLQPEHVHHEMPVGDL